jgi:periplasmic protein TonB
MEIAKPTVDATALTNPTAAPTTNRDTTRETKKAPANAQVKASGKGESRSAGGNKGAAKNYFSRLMAHLNRYKKYPTALKKMKTQGVVTLQFSINQQGQLQSARVKKSSGHPGLDAAALAMIANANPLPAIPDFMQRDSLSIAIPIEYSLITNN